MNKTKLLTVSKDTIYYLTSFSPLAFSMAICFGFREIIATMFACLAMLFAPAQKSDKIMPVFLSFMILGIYVNYAFWACVICGILLIISSFFYNKFKKLFASPAVTGVMLAAALTATVLFTTDYFGIGATGDTVSNMIKSYISLGFHPNWRGVLYGTIVMVIMITFPRKFKKLTKTVSAPFIAIIATLILNLFLNPSDMVSAITEIENSDITWVKGFLLTRTDQPFDLNTVFCGIALFVIYFYAISSNENAGKKDYIIGGISNGISGGFFSLPLPYGINKDKNSILPRILAAGIMFLLFYFGEEIMLRIPLHSCAVVIIVGAWQSVKWGELKKVFTGIAPVACFVISVISCLLLDIVHGVLLSAVISLFYSVFIQKSSVKDF